MSPKFSSYFAVIFTSIRSSAGEAEYEHMADRMAELARSQEGFLGIESVRGPDGFGVTISYWKSEESIKKWKSNSEHILAQEQGRSTWYKSYKTRICKVEREYEFESNP